MRNWKNKEFVFGKKAMADIWAGQVSKKVHFTIFYVFADWILKYFF